MYRPKNCLRCGGKMKRYQDGGYPKRGDYMDNEEGFQEAVNQWMINSASKPPQININQFQQQDLQNPFQQQQQDVTSPLNPGVIESKPQDDLDAEANSLYNTGTRDYQQEYDRSLGKGVLKYGDGSDRRNYRNFYRDKYGKGINPVDPFQIGLGIKAGTTVLSALSGRVDRKRQNQYMYNQYSTLGQNTTPQSYTNFQPNPYSEYAKFGGSLKKYQVGGLTPISKTPRQFSDTMSFMPIPKEFERNLIYSQQNPISKEQAQSFMDAQNRAYLAEERGYNTNPRAQSDYQAQMDSLLTNPAYNMKRGVDSLNTIYGTPTLIGAGPYNSDAPYKLFPDAYKQISEQESFNVGTIKPGKDNPDYTYKKNPWTKAKFKLGGNIKRYMYTNKAKNNAWDESNGKMEYGGRYKKGGLRGR